MLLYILSTLSTKTLRWYISLSLPIRVSRSIHTRIASFNFEQLTCIHMYVNSCIYRVQSSLVISSNRKTIESIIDNSFLLLYVIHERILFMCPFPFTYLLKNTIHDSRFREKKLEKIAYALCYWQNMIRKYSTSSNVVWRACSLIKHRRKWREMTLPTRRKETLANCFVQAFEWNWVSDRRILTLDTALTFYRGHARTVGDVYTCLHTPCGSWHNTCRYIYM